MYFVWILFPNPVELLKSFLIPNGIKLNINLFKSILHLYKSFINLKVVPNMIQ